MSILLAIAEIYIQTGCSLLLLFLLLSFLQECLKDVKGYLGNRRPFYHQVVPQCFELVLLWPRSDMRARLGRKMLKVYVLMKGKKL